MSEPSLTPHTDTVPATAAVAQHEHPVLIARLGPLFRLFYVNLIGTILTLGIYRFWAKTRMRRYVWSHVVVGGEGFEYTGTGKELLFGFLKALVVLAPPLVLLGITELLLDDPWSSIVRGAQYVALVLLFIAGSYAARRYRMSRTRWGGIRFHQSGSPWRYAGIYLKGGVLSALTLGLYAPYLRMQLTAYETSNLHFGSEPFGFSGTGRDLFKRWLIAWLLAVPTLMLSILRYRAAEYRYVAAHTRLANLQFATTVRGRNLFAYYLVNGLILVLSLGILFPILIRRRIGFWCRWMTLDGAIDLAAIRQVPIELRSGEGLANFLDMDFLGV
ncbi:MAG: DUF898 domain-containing protein [Proteobacteria bacterium]|nr:DUF898 domain-containing protein [Pseudomonadota bacterium]